MAQTAVEGRGRQRSTGAPTPPPPSADVDQPRAFHFAEKKREGINMARSNGDAVNVLTRYLNWYFSLLLLLPGSSPT